MLLASIVVPVYNVEKYIKGCIESLLNQTCENFEIILVDDGSTDSSAGICDDYVQKDKRVRVIHKKNGGLSDARNKGADEAKGTFLFFIDGDDTVSPRLVENAVACAKERDADLVFFDFESIEEETGRRDLYHYGLPMGVSFNVKTNPEVLIKSPSACCCLYKKAFWEKSGIRYPKGMHYEDLATTPRLLLKAEKIGYTGEEPLYYYMLRRGSIMRSSNFERSFHDRTRVLSFLNDFFQEQGAGKEYKQELEFLLFEHGYFIPLKEIILEDVTSPWLADFREYALSQCPELMRNPYIAGLSGKDKLLLFLMKRKLYRVMNLLSGIRRRKDHIKKGSM